MKKHIIIAILAAIIMAAIFVFGYDMGRRTSISGAQESQSYTVSIIDTLMMPLPKPATETIIKRVPYPVHDTIRERDTLYIMMDRTRKMYEDENYRAWVSGVDPCLDSLNIFSKTKVVTTTVTKQVKSNPKWSIGVGGGYGFAFRGTELVMAPYIGVQVSYNLLTW